MSSRRLTRRDAYELITARNARSAHMGPRTSSGTLRAVSGILSAFGTRTQAGLTGPRHPHGVPRVL